MAKSYLKEKRLTGSYEAYNTNTGHVKKLFEFTRNEEITYPEIIVELLRGFPKIEEWAN